MRALFQILIGMATATTVASRIKPSQPERARRAGRQIEQLLMEVEPTHCRMPSRPMGASSSTTCQSTFSDRSICQARRGRLVNTNGENCQSTSIGADLAQPAAGEAAADGEQRRGELAVEERRRCRPAPRR